MNVSYNTENKTKKSDNELNISDHSIRICTNDSRHSVTLTYQIKHRPSPISFVIDFLGESIPKGNENPYPWPRKRALVLP